MNTFSAEPFNDLLPITAQVDRLQRQFRVRLDDPEYVPDSGICVETEKQVGRRKMEKMQCMRLHHLSHVYQFAKQLCGSRYFDALYLIAGLGGSQMVADRANTAYTLGNLGIS